MGPSDLQYGQKLLRHDGYNGLFMATCCLLTHAHLCTFFHYTTAEVASVQHGTISMAVHFNDHMCAEKKRKEKTAHFGVNLLRSQVLYRAAQVCRIYS